MRQYFTTLLEQAATRATESTLGLLGVTNPALREHLTEIMEGQPGRDGAFLASPLFEQTFGWEAASQTMVQLADEGLLSQEIVESLGMERPFKHQLASWRALLQEKHSIVVTSGTGSGKTECFMVPVLEDLFREYRANKSGRLVGVRALFLYPLNALINSQRERLSAWTLRFGDGIRYCLYNGNTPDGSAPLRTQQKVTPNEILSRELMRAEPAPILVTNGTMLEYMLVRQVDAPIVQTSRDAESLRWIVLDEAHTYVGSRAAELALQLRRVLAAFGVTPDQVRFIATSATIADTDGEAQLKRFLADISGIPVDRIDVIGGQRNVPELPRSRAILVPLEKLEPMAKQLGAEADPERFEMLVHSPEARAARELLVGRNIPASLGEVAAALTRVAGRDVTQRDALRWLDLCTGTREVAGKPPFLTLRAHVFQRTTDGLWACFDPNCAAKKGTSLEGRWPFGYVYARRRKTCTCGSPVFEVAFCEDCNEPHLLARDQGGHLVHWNRSDDDDFSLVTETGTDTDDDDADGGLEHVLGARQPIVLCAAGNTGADYVEHSFDKLTGKFVVDPEQKVELGINDGDAICSRPECGHAALSARLPFRRARYGVAFYATGVVPTVLEYCEDYHADKDGYGAQSLPGRGRRLITFTDSRQGTARMSVRMQQEAERSRLRGLVVEVLSAHQRAQASETKNLTPEAIHALMASSQDRLTKLQKFGLKREAAIAEAEIKEYEAMLASDGASAAAQPVTLSWAKLVNELSEKSDVAHAMLLANQYQQPEIFGSSGPHKLAEMLLFREFMRRPKRQNSLETQGLVKVGYVGLDRVKTMPQFWTEHGLTLDDWRDFLKVALDFYVRENSYVQVSDEWRWWIGSRFAPKTLRSPDSNEADEARVRRWPQIRDGRWRQRLIKLLLLGAGLNPKRSLDVDVINEWLRAAWRQLTGTGSTLRADGNRYYLPRESITFSLTGQAYACPVSNKLLDTVFRGLTPYLPQQIDLSKSSDVLRRMYTADAVELPAAWEFGNTQDDYEKAVVSVRRAVGADLRVAALRSRNLWTDINDRAVEGGFYYRTAEHSAQQSADRLQDYEAKFKSGRINVLNCSTTMEMGVDIGGVSAVVMHDVPPHPANYLQRAGRAGRRHESRSLAFTICKANPHDQEAFENPAWPFEARIPAPTVALNSTRLVQRHVNSFLLARYLTEIVGTTSREKTNLSTQWFHDEDFGDSHASKFIADLGRAESPVDDGLRHLVRGTALADTNPVQLRRAAAATMQHLHERWVTTYRYLCAEEKQAKAGSPYLGRLRIEKARHCKEYLLRDLSARTFLPGYGFPTDVVTFDTFTIEDFRREAAGRKSKDREDREDNVSRHKGLPSRNLAIAIREYAPGAEIVLDGRVFKSAGVSLHWHSLGGERREAQKFDVAWRCEACGQQGYEEGVENTSALTCTNSACQAPIKPQNLLKVLQPSGFVCDAYDPVSNDVESQRFIPVAQPWVFVTAPTSPLPNPAVGVMTSGTDGHVFHYTAGANGTGFALCMACGRTSSMLGDGTFPLDLAPDKPHRALRPTKGESGRSEAGHKCEGSASLQQGVVLGVDTLTDVFELTLRQPDRGEYISDSPNGIVLALTLAVALRGALASILGISADELGYSTRPARLESGESVRVIQLFDSVSGGAGFASTAPLHIEQLLVGMAKKLDCAHCETGCSECLLDSTTRHAADRLNRKLAADWLGPEFVRHVGLADDDKLGMLDARYVPGTLGDALRRRVSRGARSISLLVGGDLSDWDLTSPQFRRDVLDYVQQGVDATLLVPAQIDDRELLHDLWALTRDGVKVCVVSCLPNPSIIAQVVNGDDVLTFATRDEQSSTPGPQWHGGAALVVASASLAQLEAKPLAFPTFSQDETTGESVVEFSIRDVLDGPLTSFGDRFWDVVGENCAQAKEPLANERVASVGYTDRYLQSPTSIAILGSVLQRLKARFTDSATVEVQTAFRAGHRNDGRMFDDWLDRGDFATFATHWLSAKAGTHVSVQIARSNREIAHHRTLQLSFESGSRLRIRLDQGFGYWQVRIDASTGPRFDFTAPVDDQLMHLGRLVEHARVVAASDQFATPVVVRHQPQVTHGF